MLSDVFDVLLLMQKPFFHGVDVWGNLRRVDFFSFRGVENVEVVV